MGSLLLALILSPCPETVIVNKTSTWVELDRKSVDRAKYTCGREYMACLAEFRKIEERRYHAICK